MRKGDWILISLLLLAGVALLLISRPSADAQLAKVYWEGALVQEIPLSREGAYRWENGEDYVEIAISGGKAFVARASCPDGDCLKRGKIALAGESIVCLPNRLSVVLEGGNALDAVVY